MVEDRARARARGGPGGASVWDRLGRAWDRLWYTSPRATAQEVRAILSILTGGAPERLPRRTRFLDVGCGTGRHALALARMGFEVVGVELSSRMVAAARAKRRRARPAGRLHLVRGDALALPVRPGSIDVALSLCEGAFGTPTARGASQRLLREVVRALRPGGVLVLVALNRSWLDRQGDWRYDPALGRNVGRERHALEDGTRRVLEISTRAYTPARAARLAASCGLEIVARLGAAPGAYGVPAPGPGAMQYLLVGKKNAAG